MATWILSVEGMTCGGCVRHVEKALRATPGVTEAIVDLATHTATVTGTASLEALATAVAEAGYHMAGPA